MGSKSMFFSKVCYLRETYKGVREEWQKRCQLRMKDSYAFLTWSRAQSVLARSHCEVFPLEGRWQGHILPVATTNPNWRVGWGDRVSNMNVSGHDGPDTHWSCKMDAGASKGDLGVALAACADSYCQVSTPQRLHVTLPGLWHLMVYVSRFLSFPS